MIRRQLVIAVSAAALCAMFAMGIRSGFGLFLQPISQELGTGRETFSLAMAINSLIYGVPLVGFLADRIGPRLVLILGGILYAVGLVMVTQIATPGMLMGSLGLLVGFALSATTFVVVLGAVGQIVPAELRSRAFGFVTAAGGLGMVMMPPVTQFLLDTLDWRTTMMILAGLVGLIVVFAFGLPSRAGSSLSAEQTALPEEPFMKLLRRASVNPSYLMLTAGFFVCGFHVSFISVHLPPFLGDNGLPGSVAAATLSLIGGFNIVGSYLFGWLGDKYRKKHLLSLLYLGRSIVITIFLLVPISQTSALVFGAAIGFLWLATVPLTSGSVAAIFGTRYLATLYGIVFLSHQVGSFLGVWLGGRLYDTTGSYDLVWYMSIGLGILAALVHLPISEKRAGDVAAELQPA